MKTITLNEIRELHPCYDPAKYLSENWTGTVIDILNVDDCPAKDRLWVVLREDFIDAKTLRLFAVWCARKALNLIENPDQRSIEACDVSERYANNEATKKDLDAARAAARAAAMSAARAAAWAAAWSAASDAAWSAAMSAASDAAMSAASDAAMSAASDAAWAAAMSAASDAARAAQINQLKKMLS